MRLADLRIADYRNLGLVHLIPSPRFNVLEGKNGQGKTNLLEAIWLLSALKPFRTSKNVDLVRFGATLAEVRAVLDSGDGERTLRVQVSREARRIWVDGKVAKTHGEALGQVAMVVFTPEDLAITKGSPSGRRRFLDRAVFTLWPASLDDFRRFQHALDERNALLKAPGVPDDLLLDVYDDQVATAGALVGHWRRRYLERFAPVFAAALAEITTGGLEGTLTLQPSIAEPSRDALHQALVTARPRDRARQSTTRGPQHDELDASLDGRPLRTFGSQGQHRAFVLAMKIAEIRLLARELGRDPVLLLDDVSSELDDERNAALMRTLVGEGFGGQVFLSTTDRRHVLPHLPLGVFDSGQAACFTIRDGAVTL